MFPAFLTTLLFSISAITANRSIAQLGSNLANISRLLVAAVLLGLMAWVIGEMPGSRVIWIFVISGVVGFGFGDLGVFYALPRLGSRLCILYTQCVAAPIAGLIEWFWLGSTLSGMQIVWAIATLVGVAIALDPRHAKHFQRKYLVSGTLFGLLAAVGQGGGAVVSRFGYDLALAADESIPAITAAFLRVVGGVVIALLALWIIGRGHLSSLGAIKHGKSMIWFFIVLNALSGPVLGVSCYQWALASQPSFVVLPIVALSPIVVIPLAMIWEHDRPSLTSCIGAVIAVGSAILLAFETLRG